MTKNILCICVTLLSVPFFLFPIFTQETCVQTVYGVEQIQNLRVGDYIYGYDNYLDAIVTTRIVQIIQKEIQRPYKIDTEDGSFICSADQTFYDLSTETWIEASQLSSETVLLSSSLQPISCFSAVEVLVDSQIMGYDVSLAEPHTFFISQAHILTHNIAPLFVLLPSACAGVVSFLGGAITVETTAIATATAGASIWGYYKVKHARNNQHMNQNEHSKDNPQESSKDPGREPGNKIFNMNQFFLLKFGKEIKKYVEKTKKLFQGKSIYRVKQDIRKYRLQKNDQFYLDNFHKDHIEVFDSKGRFRQVLNLDGTVNFEKTQKAIGRTLYYD